MIDQLNHFSKFFVTGIGTEVGKTVASAILTRALEADYWKPVQAGDLDRTDTKKVRQWSALEGATFFPERHRLLHPMSPHAAAARESLKIQLGDFTLPATERPLIVEGAGGLYVPLNAQHTILDLIEALGLPVILVSRHYLGSINHSLLSIAALRARQIPVAALIFNGTHNPETEQVIEEMGGIKGLFNIDELPRVDAKTVAQQADKHGEKIRKLLTREFPGNDKQRVNHGNER